MVVSNPSLHNYGTNCQSKSEEETVKEVLLEMRPREAAVIAALVVAVMGVTMIRFGWTPHLSVILILCALLVFGKSKGLEFGRMQHSMARGVLSGIGAIYLFFFIGLLVSALKSSLYS